MLIVPEMFGVLFGVANERLHVVQSVAKREPNGQLQNASWQFSVVYPILLYFSRRERMLHVTNQEACRHRVVAPQETLCSSEASVTFSSLLPPFFCARFMSE